MTHREGAGERRAKIIDEMRKRKKHSAIVQRQCYGNCIVESGQQEKLKL